MYFWTLDVIALLEIVIFIVGSQQKTSLIMGFILLSLTWIQQQCFRWVQVRDLFHVLEVMTEAHPPYRLFER
ncbi:MAG: hypothetical protein CL862_05730 [Cyanobium sp. NAT70]|nr:hypothetical protein [Cyanobium sp. NAT70]